MNKFDFFPADICAALSTENYKNISELRLRTGYPIIINCCNQLAYLSKEGITLDRKKSLICSEKDISQIVLNVTERSLYAFNDRLKQGFITTKDGLRIGVAGECVLNEGQVVTIKNISSLNIRVPHEVTDCSSEIYEKIMKNGIRSTLIISPPGQGKTTLLKDIALKINKNYNYNILIIDERGEFENVKGENIDSIKYSDKFYAFNYALRSMSPQIVITDELSSKSDWDCALAASNSGVKIISSCHAKNVSDLCKKPYFLEGIFERFAELRAYGRPGQTDRVLNENFEII